ncbi:metal-sulfur cluster assembly factor [Candidatus Woesearchaeota archaeon]|nr:metal-sulfur cluster assembly factor [Candidatus Woesearchaeota archaeon]
MKKDYENPDIVDEDNEITGIKDKNNWETGRKEQEKKIGVTEPYPKKTLEEIEKETDKKIIEVIKNVQDPELGVDIWSLGLIYDINKNGKLDITMTFTSPMCPYGPQIVNELKSGLKNNGYEEEKINIDVVFNPLWEPSEELKEALGFGG